MKSARSRPAQTMLKINLGSATAGVEGWVNIDNSLNIYLSKFPVIKKIMYKLGLISEDTLLADWRRKNVKRHNVTKGLPFKTRSVDAIYCSHLLEHLIYTQAEKVCREAHRVLKENGIFRVCVPDLKLYARKYIDGDREFFGNPEKPLGHAYLESMRIQGLSKRPLLEREFSSLHRWMYDEESLAFLLKSARFHRITILGFRLGLCPDLEKIEHRKASIYIEAQK